MSGARARLFVALELPEQVRDALVTWRDQAVGRLRGVRPIAREDLHVTLCFLGWRLETEIDPIAEACGVLAGRSAPELSLGDALALPRRRPRVLAVAVEDPETTLGAAQAVLAAALAAGGWYRPEQRSYLPHVTAGRLASGTRLPSGQLPSPPRREFKGARVTLYRSRLSPAGARYEALRSWT